MAVSLFRQIPHPLFSFLSSFLKKPGNRLLRSLVQSNCEEIFCPRKLRAKRSSLGDPERPSFPSLTELNRSCPLEWPLRGHKAAKHSSLKRGAMPVYPPQTPSGIKVTYTQPSLCRQGRNLPARGIGD
ncbi:alpha-1,3-mannosyl-glycoprotein 4-beta-N-acetylglucosaminyltransferase C-like [Platysternon megacephalum]|uniref:Alpha-1,3-mannosyl-glycoprotein 4-beta-N-acetylglucosaminyltransferase C-like n=1 Tax=Platysternon megacephalum TaxID=55544 RepID=A0A4D9E010_9SAUR|nr:alpha-1,3-mannosyl-glycoprotein 4-beta-N-acetylglucosaminyltransferase C-like [Platysternon megacephalum]